MDSMIIYLIKASLVAAFTYLAYVDSHSFRLPNRITLPLIVLGMTFNGLFEQQFVSATSAWIGAVVGYGSLWALNATYRLVRGKMVLVWVMQSYSLRWVPARLGVAT